MQGEQLSCVIIDRLPFAVPSDPVVAARVKAIDAGGGNAFFDYQVPAAVITLKQGFGRLIRSLHDRGLLVLLDNRILKKQYGRVFVESLPKYKRTTEMRVVEEFFGRSAERRSEEAKTIILSSRIPMPTARLSKVTVSMHPPAWPLRSTRQSENPALPVLNFRKALPTISDLRQATHHCARVFENSSTSVFSKLYSDLSTQLSSAITTSETNPESSGKRTHQFMAAGVWIGSSWVRKRTRTFVSRPIMSDNQVGTTGRRYPSAIASSISSIVAGFPLSLKSPFNS